MKLRNLFLAILGVAALAFGFSSCSKDASAPAPKIKFQTQTTGGSAVTTYDGTTKFFVIVMVDEGTKLDKLTFMYKYGSSNSTEVKLNTTMIPKTHSYFAEFDPMQDNMKLPADEGKIVFVASDKNGNSTTEELAFKKGGAAPAPAATQMGETKKGYLNHGSGAKPGAFNLKTGAPVSLEKGAAADRYMMHLTDGKGKPFAKAFCSDVVPAVSNAAGNHTKFVSVTLNFEKATVEECKDAFDKGAQSEKVTGVAAGQMFVAIKDKEIYLIKITEVSMTGTRAGSEGYMSFDYKMGMLK